MERYESAPPILKRLLTDTYDGIILRELLARAHRFDGIGHGRRPLERRLVEADLTHPFVFIKLDNDGQCLAALRGSPGL